MPGFSASLVAFACVDVMGIGYVGAHGRAHQRPSHRSLLKRIYIEDFANGDPLGCYAPG